MTLVRKNLIFRFLHFLPFLLVPLALGLISCKDGANSSKTSTDTIEPALAEPTDAAEPGDETRTVLFLGNSLSAGLGVEEEEAFPALIADRIDSLGWPYRVVNAGLSGETSAGGLRRIDWLLRQPVDVLVLELGGNDGLRGISPANMEENLQGIIDATLARYPAADIVVAGMQAPPNLGQRYTQEFREVFETVAEDNDAALIPFLLEGVGGVPELNQSDGIHPTPEGHRIIAETVWTYLAPVLEQRMAS